MKESMDRDRRQHRRLELTNLVAYKSFSIEEVTETINISLGGMKIKTEFPIDKDASLDVALRIGNDEFRSEARVIYCNPRDDEVYEVGLQFEKTSEKHLKLLDRYLGDHHGASAPQ
jgi:c-di-GMP-binding flagellar brake protein YcgR